MFNVGNINHTRVVFMKYFLKQMYYLGTENPHTHVKKKKKTLPFVPTPHSHSTPLQLSMSTSIMESTPKLAGCRRRVAVVFQRAHAFAAASCAAYRHQLASTYSTWFNWDSRRIFCGLGPGIFLLEKVINLAKIFSHLLSHSVYPC